MRLHFKISYQSRSLFVKERAKTVIVHVAADNLLLSVQPCDA